MLTQPTRDHSWVCPHCNHLIPANCAHKCPEFDRYNEGGDWQADTGDRDYYRTGDIECIDAIKAALGSEGFIAFLRGQVIKYNWRLASKGNPVEDSIKANWYQTRLTKELQDEQPVADTRVHIRQCRASLATIVPVCIHCDTAMGDEHKSECLYRKSPPDPRGSSRR